MVIEKDVRDMLLVWNNVYEFSAHALLSQSVIYLTIGLVKTRERVLIWAPLWISFIKIINYTIGNEYSSIKSFKIKKDIPGLFLE